MPLRKRPPGKKVKPQTKPRAEGEEREDGADEAKGQRLQKVLAAAGVGSRRQCEELIEQGRVEVDQEVVVELGTRVTDDQEVRVDGVPIKLRRRSYYLVNKPVGVVSTNRDPAGRPRVIDLLPKSSERLFTVGRLDLNSEGLILLTNDGELANQLAHPRYGVEKTYLATVAGVPAPEVLQKLRAGVHLAEGVARVVSVKIRSQHKQSATLEVVLAEGKNREIRRILARVGHKVMKLKRVAIDGLKLGDLQPGEFRRLRAEEVQRLRDATRPASKKKGARRRTAKRPSRKGAR